MKNNLLKLVPIAIVAFALGLPRTSNAQHQGKTKKEIARRQKTKGDWQKAANISGAAALLGIVTKNNTLTYIGAGTSLYSIYRMQEDTKSQNRTRRQRAAFYSQSQYTKNGVRYDRKLVHKNGQSYYRFVKHRG